MLADIRGWMVHQVVIGFEILEAQREALEAAEEFSKSVEESIKFGLDSVATSFEESLYNVRNTLQKEGFKKSYSEVTASNQKVGSMSSLQTH